MYRAALFFSLFLGLVAGTNAQVIVEGKLLGQDGKPMPAGNVFLIVPMESKAMKTSTADSAGNYSMTIDSAGLWMLRFAGVNHYSFDVPLYFDSAAFSAADNRAPIDLNVRLRGYSYFDTLKNVKIVGTFNKFSRATAVSMQRQPDGTFTAEFETKADTFAYQILGAEKSQHTINGTQSERYKYDGGGDYESVVTPKDGRVKIVFDPAKLVRDGGSVTAAFRDTGSVVAKFASLYEELGNMQAAYIDTMSSFRQSGKNPRDFRYDTSPEAASLQNRLKAETEPALRQELQLGLLWLTPMGEKPDSSIFAAAIQEIPASSPIWALSTVPIQVLSMVSALPDTVRERFIQSLLEENPNEYLKAYVAYQQFIMAKYSNKKEKAARYYALLTTKLANTEVGKMVKERFSPDAVVEVGKPVPRFSVVSMEDSTKIISNETLKGKYYLMDFWATWCAPCVSEMPNIDKAYKEFKDKNFVILSLSLDNSPADVEKFRKEKWPMPWLHTFVRGGWDASIIKDFSIVGIPMPVLVDPRGIVVATEAELRGEELTKTLEKFLGKPVVGHKEGQ